MPGNVGVPPGGTGPDRRSSIETELVGGLQRLARPPFDFIGFSRKIWRAIAERLLLRQELLLLSVEEIQHPVVVTTGTCAHGNAEICLSNRGVRGYLEIDLRRSLH